MDKHALWKWLLLIGLGAWSLALVLPFERNVKLGLDLRGGTSFTLEIDSSELKKQLREQEPDLGSEQIENKAAESIRSAQKQALEIIRNRVDALGVAEPMIYPEKENRIVVQIPGLEDDDRARARDLIQSAAFLEFSMVHEHNDRLVDDLFAKGLEPPGYKIASVDEGGRRMYYYRRDAASASGAEDGSDAKQLQRFQAPSGFRFMLKEEIVQGQKLYKPHFVRQRSEMRGDTVRYASQQYDQMGRPYVTLKFDAKGTRDFARVTKAYAPGGERNTSEDGRHYLAIILDDTLYSAPYIKTAIYGGEAIIEGRFSLEEAQNLAIVLGAGSLPAPVKIIESRSVDPTLGRDSIESGLRATIYSCVAVVAFMLIYYMLAGVIADLGLLISIILLPLGMWIAAGFLGLFASGGVLTSGRGMTLPVLTLPGIAGIALTLGMAVDANVLIFERIREELKLGKRLAAAVEAGYHKAFVTILDSNLTTVISAIILFIFGTGAVRGFGVTLTAGILVSMYTALIVSRMFFNILTTRFNVSSLKMLALIKDSNINFIKWRKVVGILSLAVIVGTWGIMLTRGMSDPSRVLGTDFTGGISLTFALDAGKEKPGVDELRKALAARGFVDANIQYQKELDKSVEYLEIRFGAKASDAVSGERASLKQSFKEDYGLSLKGEEEVGPQIGKEMSLRAIGALALALVGMIIYVSFRFRFSFALGAILALLHDVLVCVGLYSLAGRQINMPTIAALLAIVGYSINDTIVTFDRIRENMTRVRNRPFDECCNLSINETLSRTVLTSVTTLLAAGLLFFFGGGAINDFALIFVFGILVGTYSSIYMATPLAMAFGAGKRRSSR